MTKQKETAGMRRTRLAKEYRQRIAREDKALLDRLREGIAKMEKEVEEETAISPRLPQATRNVITRAWSRNPGIDRVITSSWIGSG